jgi:hypothetical protein
MKRATVRLPRWSNPLSRRPQGLSRLAGKFDPELTASSPKGNLPGYMLE